MLFTLTVIGPYVLYRTRDGEPFVFDSHRKAYRYLQCMPARRVTGSARCISGMYIIG